MPQKKSEPVQSPDMYYPSNAVIKQANVKEYESLYKRSITDREGFWADEAKKLKWFKKWNKVLDDSEKPFYKWFTGGKINIVQNAIDRHPDLLVNERFDLIANVGRKHARIDDHDGECFIA